MNMHSGLTLAYLGDAIWEIRIREYLMGKGLTKVNDLHKTAIRYTSATGEAIAADRLQEGFLSEAETDLFKRGRNAESTHKPKAVDLGTYHKATGFEAVLGHLYLENQMGRLAEIIAESIRLIEETL
jgi:ribonuclease-3 family protein